MGDPSCPNTGRPCKYGWACQHTADFVTCANTGETDLTDQDDQDNDMTKVDDRRDD